MTQGTEDQHATHGSETASDAAAGGLNPEDSLDDAGRREMLARIARIGASTVPVSLVMLDAKKARSNTGSTPPFG